MWTALLADTHGDTKTHADAHRRTQTNADADERGQTQTNAWQTAFGVWADATSRRVQTLDVCSRTFGMYYMLVYCLFLSSPMGGFEKKNPCAFYSFPWTTNRLLSLYGLRPFQLN